MIAIFVLVGLVLFGGGLYGVYDGWPYLVLERGFTEVIIGSISAAAGLIMLSLAWVLKQLGLIRHALAAAAEARAAAPVLREAARPAAPPAAPMVESAAPSPGVSSPLVPAALGVGAAAVALAVADEAEAAAPAERAPERDLFGGLVADRLASTPDEETQRQDEPEPVEALPDMFATEIGEPAPIEVGQPVAVEAESSEPAEIVAARVQPVSQDEALAHSDETAETAVDLAGLDEPLRAEADVPSVEDVEDHAEEEGAGRDEFTVLRESLSSQLGGLNQPGERIEPGFAQEDSFTAAEAWMRFPERREPRLDLTPPAAEAEPEAPVWPPRTEAQNFDVPAADPAEEAGAPRASEEAGAERGPDEPASPVERDPDAPETAEAAASVDEEPPGGAAEPPSPEPAASEEGIVGAYQVGDAHFTIYVDGSIRARTPDGEYSFASMDELKVYLASEKSRLGV